MGTRRFRWEKVLLAVVAVYVALILLITVIATVYGLLLGVQARGAPDGDKIADFARMLGVTYAPWGCLVFTFFAAIWASRRTALPVIHGLLVGLLVEIIGFLMGSELTLTGILFGLLTVAAGGFGGFLSPRAHVNQTESAA